MKQVSPQEIITNLVNGFDIPRETIAGKMRVSAITIFRWQYTKTSPTHAELEKLNRLYRGYDNTKKLKLDFLQPSADDIVDDFYSLPPRCKTKRKLKKMLQELKEVNNV